MPLGGRTQSELINSQIFRFTRTMLVSCSSTLGGLAGKDGAALLTCRAARTA